MKSSPDAQYRKNNDRSLNSSTYHKKDGTPMRAILKREAVQEVAVSLVDASHVKSQWQAHFLQLFPIGMDKLPRTHESDRQCFKDHWKGDPEMTYDALVGRSDE